MNFLWPWFKHFHNHRPVSALDMFFFVQKILGRVLSLITCVHNLALMA